jgi:hypothetical protein
MDKEAKKNKYLELTQTNRPLVHTNKNSSEKYAKHTKTIPSLF